MFRNLLLLALFACSCRNNSRSNNITVILLDTLSIRSDNQVERENILRWRRWEKPAEYYPRYFLYDETLKIMAPGHTRLDGSYGDIDDNGTLDGIMITAHPEEDSLSKTGKKAQRELLVFLDQGDLSFRSKTAIPPINSCDNAEPYAGHLALTGRFILYEECGSNGIIRYEYRFDYVPRLKDWKLDTVVTQIYSQKTDKYILDTFTRPNIGNVFLRSFDIYKVKSKLK